MSGSIAPDDFTLEKLKAAHQKKQSTNVRIGEFADGTPIDTAVYVISGEHEGPTLFLNGAIHGNEIFGPDVIRHVIKAVNPSDMEGTLVGIPIAAKVAFFTRTYINPLESYPYASNMNRVFGKKSWSPEGNLTERMTDFIFYKIIPFCDFILDLHAAVPDALWPYNIVLPPKSMCKTEELFRRTEEIVKAFGAPFVLGNYDYPEGSLVNAALRSGIPSTWAELGTAFRIRLEDREFAVKGILNLMKKIKMLKGNLAPPANQITIDMKKSHKLVASRGGFLTMKVGPGQRVQRGEVLAEISNLDCDVVEVIESPVDGYALRQNTFGTVSTGDHVIVVGVTM